MLPQIYNTFTDLIHTLAADLTGNDPMSKGLLTVAILSGLAVALRSVPGKIASMIIGRFTVSIEFCNDWNGDNKDMFAVAGDFVSRNQYRNNFKLLRSDVDAKSKKVTNRFSVPSSIGIFFYRLRPYYYLLSEAQENGSIPEQLIIRTLGRNPDELLKTINAEKTLLQNHHQRKFYTWVDQTWEAVSNIDTEVPIFLDPQIKSQIDKKVDFFRDHKKWFEDRGINHKLLIILEGEPGTGKSRLGKYIADRLGWSLGTLLRGSALSDAVRDASYRDIVVSIPDVDSIGIGSARASMKKDDKTSEKDDASSEIRKFLDDGSLAKALNLFQGDLPLNNSVVVMSTNCVNELDPALLRPSRCDLVLTIGYLSYEQVNDFYRHYYETDIDLPVEFKTLKFKACDLMEAFTENAFDPNGFKSKLLN